MYLPFTAALSYINMCVWSFSVSNHRFKYLSYNSNTGPQTCGKAAFFYLTVATKLLWFKH